jgi:hypothetical protein
MYYGILQEEISSNEHNSGINFSEMPNEASFRGEETPKKFGQNFGFRRGGF